MPEKKLIRFDNFFAQWTKNYYQNQNPFGKSGDFITAPETSQLFGEATAAWIVKSTMHYKNFALLELGAGKGTWMHDILHTLNKWPDIYKKLKQVYVIEQSTSLKMVQQQKLKNYNVHWASDIKQIEFTCPTIVVANEFLDALPVRIFKVAGGVTYEGYVQRLNDSFDILYKPTKISLNYPDGVYEISFESKKLCHSLKDKIKSGKSLFIDYGYFEPPKISTIQAVKSNKKVNWKEYNCDADITYLVNFTDLAANFAGSEVKLSTQSNFLIDNHVKIFADKLISLGYQLAESELNRLIGEKQMGNIFKVLEVSFD